MSVRGSERIDNISRDESPEGLDGSPEKRAGKKRKVLSCYACRSRKMKCDRVYPVCGRCEKNGRSKQCRYDPRFLAESNIEGMEGGDAPIVLKESSRKTPTPADVAPTVLEWKVRSQERRIESLERRLVAQSPKDDPLRHEHFSPQEPGMKEEMMFRGKGFKTAFHGATSIMSSIACYRELQLFTREALTVDHSIVRVKTDFKTFRDQKKRSANEQRDKFHGTDEEVFAALPDKTAIDMQAVIYFQTWETSYKILHEPSFWHEYDQFWEQRHTSARSVSFAVLLLLLVASIKCVTPKDDVFIGDTTSDRQAAADLIDTCEAWIVQQPRKRQTLSFFQIHCLCLLAKRANCVRLKQDWVNSGDLVRLAMASGMHRDPTLLATGKISAFEKEMKKRIWATITELELQSSVEAGLQSSLTNLYVDAPAPMNVDDDAFSIGSTGMPISRPLEQFTSVSYLVVSQRSLPLRVQLTQLLNTPTSRLQYTDVLHYDARIQTEIASLPTWEERSAVIPSALLRLQLRQYLLMLHKPYAKLAPKDQRYVYSLTTVVDTASSIIGIYEDLSSHGILALNHFRNDVLRVGLTISHVVYENCTQREVSASTSTNRDTQTHLARSENHFADVPIHGQSGQTDSPFFLAVLPIKPSLSRTLCVVSIELLERTRQLFQQKVMRLGTGYMECWLLLAAIGMLPAASSPSTSITYPTNTNEDILARCTWTLDRFTTLASRVLALQEDVQTIFASSLRTTIASTSQCDGIATSVSAGNVAVSDATTRLTDPASCNIIPNGGLGLISGETSNNLGGPFDILQDMQVDLGGWSFPDFWTFDLGGDY